MALALLVDLQKCRNMCVLLIHVPVYVYLHYLLNLQDFHLLFSSESAILCLVFFGQRKSCNDSNLLFSLVYIGSAGYRTATESNLMKMELLCPRYIL